MTKIMVVDDDIKFLEEFSDLLRSNDYEVVALHESKKVVPAAREELPDIIILDLNMDEMSGFQVADELRNQPETKDIPVIGITGFYTEKEHGLFMRVCGINECLMKPINPRAMILAIENAVKRRKKKK